MAGGRSWRRSRRFSCSRSSKEWRAGGPGTTARARQMGLVDHDVDGWGGILPCHFELGVGAAGLAEGDLEGLHGRWRLRHLHGDAAEILLGVVVQASLAGLLVDYELPGCLA